MDASELIAKFDGWERVYPGTASRRSRGLAQFQNKDGRHWHCYIADGVGEGVWPPFQTSWDFLMPVIYRIGEIDNQACEELAAQLKEKNFLILQLKMVAQIHIAYRAAVEFIEWYNNVVMNNERCVSCGRNMREMLGEDFVTYDDNECPECSYVKVNKLK